jgi:hypothetical protein
MNVISVTNIRASFPPLNSQGVVLSLTSILNKQKVMQTKLGSPKILK